MASTPNKKHQHKKQLSQLKETLNFFLIVNNIIARAIRKETLPPGTISLPNYFWSITVGENSACQNQVFKKNFDDKVRITVDNAIMTVKIRVCDAILTTMYKVVLSELKGLWDQSPSHPDEDLVACLRTLIEVISTVIMKTRRSCRPLAEYIWTLNRTEKMKLVMLITSKMVATQN